MTCEEWKAEADKKDAEFKGEDDRLEVEEIDVDKACKESDADCVDKGGDSELLVEIEKVGKRLSNVIVTRVVGTIEFAILEALIGCKSRREGEQLHD